MQSRGIQEGRLAGLRTADAGQCSTGVFRRGTASLYVREGRTVTSGRARPADARRLLGYPDHLPWQPGAR